jgi:hypothetical protein
MVSTRKFTRIPSAQALLEQLRCGAILDINQHTLALDEGVGANTLSGVDANGLSYYGSLTLRYVQWWRTRMVKGQVIGEAPPYVDDGPSPDADDGPPRSAAGPGAR